MTDRNKYEGIHSDEISFESVDAISRRSVLHSLGVFGGVSINEWSSDKLSKPPVDQPNTSRNRNTCKPSNNRNSPPPGPAVLHAPLATAPQFENGERWNAAPLKVSGANAYIDGEYLYQDFIYDDHGANTTDLPLPPNTEPGVDYVAEEFTELHEITGGTTDNEAVVGAPTGDVVYPTDEDTYRYNAADLVEFRATLSREKQEERIAYRITLNTMRKVGAAGVALGIDKGGSSGTDTWGYGIGDLGPLNLDHIIATWGNKAKLDGRQEGVTVDVSERRNQIELITPFSPTDETWRHYLVVGLFDQEHNQFKQIKDHPSETHPGGAHGTDPPPIFNVGFRSHDQEPLGAPNLDTGTTERQIAEATNRGSRSAGFGHWRDHSQAKALEARDISNFHADIDFAKLRSGTTEDSIPTTGFINRLYSSHHDFGEGIDGSKHTLTGRIQPYAMYIPEQYYPEESPAPLLLMLHSHSCSYNQYGVFTPNLLKQLGEHRESLILMPEGRGANRYNWWNNKGELDVFEAWADAAANYTIDFDRACISGYSMGGYGTYKLASQYPDLFAKGFSIVGPPNIPRHPDLRRISDNLRNVPLLIWQGTSDVITFPHNVIRYEQKLRDHGYRHELDIFPGYDHLMFQHRDQWDPGRAFLGNAEVERAPAQVTFRAVPEYDNEDFGLIHNKAYWISDITVADDADSGLVDVCSEAFDGGEPVISEYRGAGTDPAPHTKRGTRWKTPNVKSPPENVLHLELEEVRAVTIWIEEANLTPEKPIEMKVDSTTPATISLKSPVGIMNIEVEAGTSARTIQICNPSNRSKSNKAQTNK
jgi:dienelactone hydrolase